ncbi:MAG: hypothetical protein RLY57_209 [Candidatus Parcubacteria bacterium]|jgi:hypothetical protein
METILFVLAIAGLLVFYASFTFSKIPDNHIRRVDVNKRLVHLMTSKSAKKKIVGAIKSLPNKYSKKQRLLELAEHEIVSRDEWVENWWNFFIFPILANVANLHFLSFIPFTSFRPVNVVKTRINLNFKEGDKISAKVAYDKADHSAEATPDLRVDITRVVFLRQVEIMHGTQLDIVLYVKGLIVIDPHDIFETNPDISAVIDLLLESAAVNFFARYDFDKFLAQNFTPDPISELNRFFKDTDPRGGAGLYTSGIMCTGEVSVVAFDLSESQKALADERIALEKQRATLQIDKLKAEGMAATITATEGAKNDALERRGQIEAKNAQLLAASIAKNPELANVLAARELASGSLAVIGGNVMPQVTIPTPPTKPTGTP